MEVLSVSLSELFSSNTCYFCGKDSRQWNRHLRTIHYLWKHPIEYVDAKRVHSVQKTNSDDEHKNLTNEISSIPPVELISEESDTLELPEITHPEKLDPGSPAEKRCKFDNDDISPLGSPIYEPDVPKSTDGTRPQEVEAAEAIILAMCRHETDNEKVKEVFVNGSDSQQDVIFQIVLDDVEALATDRYGASVIGHLLRAASAPRRKSLCEALADRVHLAVDEFAVVLLCTVVELCSDDDELDGAGALQNLVGQVAHDWDRVVRLSTNEHAHALVNAILTTCERGEQQQLVDFLIISAKDIACDQYGASVLREVVCSGSMLDVMELIPVLVRDLMRLIQDEHAHTIFLTLLKHGAPQERHLFLEKLLFVMRQSERVLTELLRQSRSRAVISEAIESCTDKGLLVEFKTLIKPYLNLMHANVVKDALERPN